MKTRAHVTDIVDQKTRSQMMAGIRGKNTKPELALRKGLHALGFRFRLHSNKVNGKPDLVLPKHRAVVFVHGCFWHRHYGCRYTTTPSTRPEFWQMKFEANAARDVAVRAKLLESGWRVATVWECALRKSNQIEITVLQLTMWLNGSSADIELGNAEARAAKNSE